MLPVKRITIGELWQLLTVDKKPQEYGPTSSNGHPITHGHMNGHGKKMNGKIKGANGYWWSK